MSDDDNKIVSLNKDVFNPNINKDLGVDIPLNSALKSNLVDVVIVGRDHAGEITVWGSAHDADKSIGLMSRGLTWLATAKQVNAK